MIVTTAPGADTAPHGVSVHGPGRSARIARLLPAPLADAVRRMAARRRGCNVRPDAVHVLGRSMLRTGIAVSARTGAQLVLDCAPDEGWAPRSARALRRERNALRACAAVVTASESDALALRERQRLHASPLVSRDVPEPPPPSPTPANLRRRLRLGNDPLVLVYGAEPSIEHGISVVHALASCPEVHLAVLGADRWGCADTIQLEAERLRCAARFHLLRDVPARRLAAYARDADVGLCLPAEPGEKALLDSLYHFAYAGLPVIVPPVSEGERVVGRFDIGWIADPGNPGQLVSVLERACGTERGTRKSSAARAGTVLVWKVEAQILLGLYDRLGPREEHVLPPAPRRLGQLRRNARALAGELRSRRGRGLQAHPRAFAHHVWGMHLRQRGDYGKSLTHFERALRHAPDDDAAKLRRAASLKDAGRTVEAIEAYRELLAAQDGKPNTTAVNASINLARLGVRREPHEVLALLSEKAQTPSQFARCAELAAALGDVRAARTAVDRAVELTPDDPALRKVEARVLEQAGEPERALASAARASDSAARERLEGVLRTYDAKWHPTPPPQRSITPVAGRVLHLLETSLPHATTGYSYRTRTVLAAQRSANLEPVAATRLGFPANRGVKNFAHTEVVEGVVHHRFTLPGVRRYTSVPPDQQVERNVEMVAGLVDRIRPAVMHATTPHYNGLLGLSLRSAFDIPLLYEVRGFPEMTWAVRSGGHDTSIYRLRREVETRCMLDADGVVTLSEVMKGHIVSRGVPAERVWVVPHMIDVEAIAPTRRSTDLVRHYGLEGRVVVGYLGTLVDYEGLDLLLRALAGLRSERPALAGLFVGGGPAEPALRAYAKDAGLDGHVMFAGRIPHGEVNEHVALFDLYVLPRHNHEVCRWVTPLKPYEAMASGRCVLTSDVEALSETVSGGCGATFAAGEVDALAEAIAALAADPDHREELAARGREKIVARHDESGLAAVAAAPIRALTEEIAGAPA